jgi:hypothetical protein
VLVIVQFCVVLGLIMAIFVSASTWPCHEEWYVVLFRRLSPTGGVRIFGIVFAAFLITGWPTLFLAHSARLATGATRFSVLNPLLDAIGSDTVGDLLNFFLEPTKETIWQAVLTIFGYAALAVANTELLRHLNDVPDTGAWGFGQLLAIALAGQPAWRAMTTFWELGFRQRPDVTPTEDELRLGFRTISRRRPPRSLARRFSQSQALSSHQTLRLLVIRVLEFVDILNLDSSGVMDDHARSAASSAANTELPRHINGVSETSAWGFGRLFTVALAGLDTRLRWRLPSLAVRFSQSHALSTNPPLRSLVIRWHTLVDTLFSREDRPPLVLTFGVPASVGEDPYIDSLEAAEHHARVEVAPVVEFEGRTHGAALSEGELALTGEGPGARPSEASADITSISASPDPIRTTVRTSPRDTPTLPERAHTEVREPNGGRCVARGGIRALEVDCTGESFALHSMEDV